MTPRRHTPSARTGLALVGLALFLAACGTPEAVRDQAARSQTNVVLISTQLENFATTRRRLAERRAESLVGWAAAIAKDETYLATEKAARARAGETATFSRIDSLRSFAAAIAAIEARADEEAEKLRAAIIAASRKLETPATDLTTLAAKLGELAEEESLKDRLKFLFAFAKEVNKEVKKAREEQEASAKKAGKVEIGGGSR